MSSNNSEKLATKDNDVEANAEKSQSETVTESAPKAAKPVFLILVILILFALNAGLFWLFKQQDSTTKSMVSSLDQAQATIASLESKLKNNKIVLENETEAVRLQLGLVGDAQLKMSEMITALRDSNQIERDDVGSAWTIAEVESLLKLANYRLLLAKDVKGAITALILADKLVQDLSDPTLYSLRTLIADELLLLESVDVPDIEGIATRLQSALNQVDSLQVMLAPVANNVSDEQQTGGVTDESEWKSVLNDTWQQMRSLVVIRHQQDGSQAVLVPEQRYFLYQNLRLKLETARFALLNGKADVYQDSLQSAAAWMEEYFTGSERDAMLDLVKKLQTENIQLVLPDISTSLGWLQQRGSEQ